MAELRWILLGLGVAFCLALWWWETRRRRQASSTPHPFESDEPPATVPPARPDAERVPRTPAPTRMEPTFEDEDEDEDEDEAAPTGDAPGRAPDPVEGLVTLRMTAPRERPFAGQALRRALEEEGLRYGKFSIFHKAGPAGRNVFSAASLLEPGTFDLQAMDTERFRGVAFFALAEEAGVQGLKDMRETAERIAARLQGDLAGPG